MQNSVPPTGRPTESARCPTMGYTSALILKNTRQDTHQVGGPMFNIVLFEPEIPSNTGNIGRTCVVSGARLHLVGPLGFDLSDPMLKRAGMNYWHNLQVQTYADWDDFVARTPEALEEDRLHLLTKRARRTYCEATYRDGDYLVFGKESTGIAPAILEAHAQACERIPMLPDAASLDDAPLWRARHDALVPGEAPAPRTDICGNFVHGEDPGISSLNLSNSVAIVLYEALRQTGFSGMDE